MALQLSTVGQGMLGLLLQCGDLEAALRQQQQAYTELEGQLSGSRQKGKELQVHLCIARCPLAFTLAHLFFESNALSPDFC